MQIRKAYATMYFFAGSCGYSGETIFGIGIGPCWYVNSEIYGTHNVIRIFQFAQKIIHRDLKPENMLLCVTEDQEIVDEKNRLYVLKITDMVSESCKAKSF